MAETVLICLGAWILLVFAASMILNGIKIASSGKTEIMPNGKEKDSPMILYPIAKWLDRHTMVKVFYSGEQLAELLDRLDKKFVGIMPEIERKDGSCLYYNNDTAISIIKGISEKLKQEGIFIHENIFVQFGGRQVSFYKEYKEYRFSKWVRMPLFGCIRCMSSFWSLGYYWLPMILVFGFHGWQVLVWIATVPAVTFVNTYIAQRYQE